MKLISDLHLKIEDVKYIKGKKQIQYYFLNFDGTQKLEIVTLDMKENEQTKTINIGSNTPLEMEKIKEHIFNEFIEKIIDKLTTEEYVINIINSIYNEKLENSKGMRDSMFAGTTFKHKTALFICEGMSAFLNIETCLENLKQEERVFYGICSLTGKPLNVLNQKEETIKKNQIFKK